MASICLSAPVIAGDQPLYQDAPDWVDRASLAPQEDGKNSPIVLLEKQVRLEEGRVWYFQDMAIKLDSPEAMTSFGTLGASWLPDKGDLIVHDLILIRDGETVDLIEGGARLEVIRREASLERRMLDGMLTASIPVPGARLGDTVRMSFSITLSDQALGDRVQMTETLPADPLPIGDGRLVLSWPQELDVKLRNVRDVEPSSDETKDGFRTLVYDVPVPEQEERPTDAPLRYRLSPAVHATTFQSWSDLSRVMAPHFQLEGTIEDGSELSATVANIMAENATPRERAAAALQAVQDDVSYLMNGLNGGNYLPQSPEETWAQRYGDCKAKSLLLAAMLHRMGIEAQVALVSLRAGDAVAGALPMPGQFDHMIVRTMLDGQEYWLDGTASGDRIDTMAAAPRFAHALPVTAEGSELVPIPFAIKQVPDETIAVTYDQSAGIRVPALVDVVIEIRGREGAPWRAVAAQADEDMIETAVIGTISGAIGDSFLIDEKLTYDADTGVARLSARGLQTTPWSRDENVYELDAPLNTISGVSFDTDRARSEWRDIPLRLRGPSYSVSTFAIALPDGGRGFAIDGQELSTQTVGGVELMSKAELADGTFTLTQTSRGIQPELPASEIATVKRSLARFERSLAKLETSRNTRETWQYFGKDRALLAPIEEIYAAMIAEADEDENTALRNRANFRRGVYDFAGALEDTEKAIEVEESESLLLQRMNLRRMAGDNAGAMADFDRLYDLDPTGAPFGAQIELMGLAGRGDEAMALADDYSALAETDADDIRMQAWALGWAGRAEEGLLLLEELREDRPSDAGLLNEVCWHSAIWDLVDEERLANCVTAVEKSETAEQVLDSRAFAYYRMGMLEEAKADLDAVLESVPSMSASRLLRGVVLKAMGNAKEGQEEIDLALKMSPFARQTYSAWGLDL